jgi:DNA-binding CsgD family transcriptional regulator
MSLSHALPQVGRAALTVTLAGDYDVVRQGVEAMVSPYADRIRLVRPGGPGQGQAAADLVLHDCFSGRHDPAAEGVWAGIAGTIVYTWAVGDGLVSSALAAGARGFLSKRLPAERLVSDLERIDAGEVVVDLGTTHVNGAAPVPPPCDPAAHLSARERQVLVLIASGLSNHEIATQCFLSINSVKTYIRSTYRKIGASTRTQAVLWALEHGLRPAPSVSIDDHEPPGELATRLRAGVGSRSA